MAKLSLINKAKRPQKFKVREYHRCPLCGRPRAYYRKFNMCRLCLRKYASRGEILGMIKSSW
ncbi:MAG: type Z 30S ribosomal protein S14 [Deltaproteobacteria bacterium CG_4_8_14_3_um_filter_45_9]|nr:MAG: type Z 30S ribosomal protein S14 [Deltaproteobacteria bacterium CG03_land_8_20_14_0_80_45_14]PIX24799.1 MAG: type Z 30S ribosomal protein S14 [Deltaproteobacteria bacterium CG_4_8_14_3_um_filter_45_9]